MKKRILSVLLCAVLAFAGTTVAFAADASAELYTIYDDDMLFKQLDDAVFAGTATPGSSITAELFDSEGESVALGNATAASNGTFEVSFAAPAGGFEEYTVVLRSDSVEFDRLERVVFGELWLASGQSNMQYPLAQAQTAREDFATAAKQSKWIRVMLSDCYSSNGIVPVEPRKDIPDADWVTGEDVLIYGASAVGFFFAEALMESLNMPVGVLNISLGGTSIACWLSREAIDSDEAVKKDFVQSDDYIPVEDWTADDINYSWDMTTSYNLRMDAVKYFRLSGMIWYQGETDLMGGWSAERYARAFDLLQRSYTELFNYEDGLLPIIFTQLAPYFYSDEGWELPERNCDFTAIQAQRPESRGMVTIHDLPVTFIPEAGYIHPEHKEEIGDRMAFSALNFVYTDDDCYTAADVKSTEIRDGSVYVTFKNVGDGLAAYGGKPGGFAICGEDGIYVQAEAEIVSNDTVRVSADSVEAPVSVSYGYSVSNQAANLYATKLGFYALPVSLFITDSSYSTQFWVDKPWADCEGNFVWHNHNDTYSAYYPNWVSDSAEINFDSQNAYSGTNGMNIKSSKDSFSVSPLRLCGEGVDQKTFYDVETQFDNYGTVSFHVRNNGEQDVVFEGMKLSNDGILWFAPACADSRDTTAVIPADGEWHLITLDLNRLYLSGNECSIAFSNDILDNVRSIDFCFSGEGADLSFDCVRFSPSVEDVPTRYDAQFEDAEGIWDFITVVFVKIIGFFASIFA